MFIIHLQYFIFNLLSSYKKTLFKSFASKSNSINSYAKFEYHIIYLALKCPHLLRVFQTSVYILVCSKMKSKFDGVLTADYLSVSQLIDNTIYKMYTTML